ncbi:unnamed protein product [Adineta steineri]|uniref:G-protein coupled receptors family 1 profile domain-containing protein n=1 Tax=Adineta steineri TaxID=433720 RepID=A0A813PDW5_9BILA|nr:unnamed protein product [Adineta steineri]CAF3846586.1 unnamed protein product [Adineta steineri]
MSNTTSNNDIVLQIQLVTRIISTYLSLTMFIIGTIGNISNIFVFTHLPLLSKLASSWFLGASFIASQLVLNTGVISRVILGFSGIDPLVSSTIWCKIRWILGPLGGSASLTCISLASIDRYFITSDQVDRHRWISVRRAQYMILIVVFIWFILLIPNGIYYTLPSCTIINTIYAQFSPIFSLVTYSIFPLLVLAIFCVLTWFNLHSNRMKLIRRNNMESQVNKMMIAQLCVILLTSVPNVILQIYTLSTRTMFKSTLRQAQEGLLSAVLSELGFVTHAGTFYVYLIASRSYRNNVKNIILSYKNGLNRVLPQLI